MSYQFQLIDSVETDRFLYILDKLFYRELTYGRYTKGIIMSLVAYLGKAQWLMSPFSTIVGIAFLALAGIVVWHSIVEHSQMSPSVLTFLCLLIAFCQPFFTDWFQFSECQLTYPFGVFCAVYSAHKAFSTEHISGIQKWFWACIWLLIGSGIYQMTMQWFVFLAMSIVIITAVNRSELSAIQITKRIAFQIIYALSIYSVAAIVQLLLMYVIFPSDRIGASQQSFAEKVTTLFQVQKDLWLMTPYTKIDASILFLVVCVLILLASIASVMKAQVSQNIKTVRIATMLICAFGFYLSILLPIFFTESWYPQRSMVGFWGIPLMFSLALNFADKPNDMERIVRMISVTISGCMIAVNVFACFQFGSDLYRTNAMDTMRAQLIEEQIRIYEEESGIQVQYLAFHYDSNPVYAYQGIKSSHENNLSAWAAAWNPLAIMNVCSGKSYKECKYSDELYYERNEDKNWDLYSPEQVFFVDETAYIVIY